MKRATLDGLRIVGSARGPRRHLPHPAGGQHAIYLTASEWRAATRAAGGLSLGSFVRRAVLSAAGVAAVRRLHPSRGAKPSRVGRVPYTLSAAERAAVDAARRDRDLTAWVRDVVRFAAGMRFTPWSPCADAVMRKGFRRWSLNDLLRALPGRNASTIYQRAKRLGLSMEFGDERMHLKDAAKFAGYDARTLAKMLRAADLPVERLAGPTPDAKRAHYFVRAADVTRVVHATTGRAA